LHVSYPSHQLLVTGATAEQLRHERLRRYFSPEVASMLANTPADDSLPESREVTLLFAYLRHFTALAERLSGTEVVAIPNATSSAWCGRSSRSGHTRQVPG